MPSLLSLCLVALLVAFVAGQQQQIYELWPEGVPNNRQAAGEANETLSRWGHLERIHVPTLSLHLPPVGATNIKNAAILVFPGGGYQYLSVKDEGIEIVHWLTSLGYVTVIVKNRVTPYKHPLPLQDGLRAVRLVRKLNVDQGLMIKKIGIIGWSAGGHEGALVSTLFARKDIDVAGRVANPLLDDLSARPDFAVLVYPVITMETDFTHMGSRINLLGNEPSLKDLKDTSAHKNVVKDTPPTLLIHSNDDNLVAVQNSIMYFEACLAARVEVDASFFHRGGHGYGISSKKAPTFKPVVENWLLEVI